MITYNDSEQGREFFTTVEFHAMSWNFIETLQNSASLQNQLCAMQKLACRNWPTYISLKTLQDKLSSVLLSAFSHASAQ